MLCPNCMSELPDGSRRCRHCGFDFTRWKAGGDAQSKRSGARSQPPEDEPDEAPPRRTLRRLVIALAILAVLGLVGFWWLAPAVTIVTQRGLIAYVSRADGNAEIYVLEANRLQSRRLTEHPAADHSPVLSPDEGRVAFVSERDGNPEVYVVNVDGTGLQRLTHSNGPDADPVWSPSGSQLAVVSRAEGAATEILLVKASGGEPISLTPHEAADDDPAWSPGGTKLAFVSDRDGNPEIYTVVADGSNLQQLTRDPGRDAQPAWSPDGSSIAFVSSRGCAQASGSSCGDLYVMSSEGNRVQRLTEAARSGVVRSPVWSPDGAKIAFTSVSSSVGELKRVFVVKADGSHIEQVGPEGASSPTWSPDSRAVAFVAGPTQGRLWFRTRPYSGAHQLCLATIGSETNWLSWAVTSVDGAFRKGPVIQVLTENGGEEPDWR